MTKSEIVHFNSNLQVILACKHGNLLQNFYYDDEFVYLK